MKKCVASVLFLHVFLVSFSQTRSKPTEMIVPVFADRADSLLYAKTNALLMERYAMMGTFTRPADSVQRHRLQKFQEGNDSLQLIARTLWGKTTRTMTVFLPRYDVWDTLSASRRTTVTRLSFTSRVKNLPSGILQCKNLEVLQLVNSSVSVIPNLSGLPNLKRIEILNNTRKVRFKKNKVLRELVIRSNEPGRTPKKFRKLAALERLDLDRSRTTEFPNIYRNKNLKTLTLAGNELTLRRLRNKKQSSLEILDFRSNKIRRVPGAIGNFSSLLSLSFSTNSIESIGDGFQRLTKLEYLILYANELYAIPPAVYQLPSLRHLDMNYNHLQRVDNGLTNLSTMTDLYLAHNEINQLPDSLGKLTNLRGLYLNNNHLSGLPESTKKITGLKELRIGNNYYGTLPAAISGLQNLSWLDVSRNELKEMPEEIFQRTNLDILSLYGNRWNARMQEQMPAWIETLRKNKTSVLTAPPLSED